MLLSQLRSRVAVRCQQACQDGVVGAAVCATGNPCQQSWVPLPSAGPGPARQQRLGVQGRASAESSGCLHMYGLPLQGKRPT